MKDFIRLSARTVPSDHSVHLATTEQFPEHHYKHKPSWRFAMIITSSAKIRRVDKMVVSVNVKQPVHLLTTEYKQFIAQWLLYAPPHFISNSESSRTAHYHSSWFSQAGGIVQSVQRLDTCWSGGRTPVQARISVPVQTGSWAHLASCTVGTGSNSRGVMRQWCGFNHPPHLTLRFKKEYSYISTPRLGFHGLL
jgi:hypothetical protein